MIKLMHIQHYVAVLQFSSTDALHTNTRATVSLRQALVRGLQMRLAYIFIRVQWLHVY